MQSSSIIVDSTVPIKNLRDAQAFILIFKSRFAMGLVFIPYQFARIGLVPATILSVTISIYIIYSIQNQVRVKQELGDKLGFKFMSYSYILQSVVVPTVLSRFIWISHEILLVTQNVMLCCCFTFLISVIASMLVEGTDIYFRLFILLLIIPGTIFYQISTYRTLSYFVAVAILFSFISFSIILFEVIEKLVKCDESCRMHVNVLLFHEYREIPIFIASFVFTISPISVLEAIEAFMQTPQNLRGWNGILSFTIGTDLISLLVFGILVPFTFRSKVLFNLLEHFLIGDLLSRFIMIFFFLSIFITTAIHFNVVFGIIWLRFFEGKFSINQETESVVALRSLLVLALYIMTICFNHLNAFIPLIGAICAIPLTLIYPYVLEIMVVWPERENHSKWRLTKIIVCLTFGFGLCVVSLFYTVLFSVDIFRNKK